jgi:hypothetical protein
MNTTLIWLLVLIPLVLVSCGNKSSSNQSNQIVTNPRKLELDTFSLKDIPDSLDGASCIYSETKQDFEKNRFILFFQVGSNYAIIKIHKTLYFLKAGLDSTYDYSNTTYSVTINTLSGKNISNECIEDTGKMTLKSKDGQTVNLNLYGTCGD